MKKLDEKAVEIARADARALEAYADDAEPYPVDVQISRPNRPSRMFNVRLSDEQYEEVTSLARQRHLPASTMARAWLLERLDQERPAS
jgi:hypothetical protein